MAISTKNDVGKRVPRGTLSITDCRWTWLNVMLSKYTVFLKACNPSVCILLLFLCRALSPMFMRLLYHLRTAVSSKLGRSASACAAE